MQTLSRNTSCYELVSIFMLINSIILSRTNTESCAYAVCENRFARQTTPANFFPFHLTLSEIILSAMKNIVGSGVFAIIVWSNIRTINNIITYNVCERLYGLKEQSIKSGNYQTHLKSLLFTPAFNITHNNGIESDCLLH